MERDVLVAYASKYGATGEIAAKIGETLRISGLQVHVQPVEAVRDLTPYRAIVLGSALYVGKWQSKAAAFLKSNETKLASRPVWLFSSGPSGEGDPLELVEGVLLPPDVQAVAERIRPRDVVVFHGNINPAKLNFIEKWAIKSIVKKPFGDYRDWKAITRWATGIAEELKQAVPA